MRAKTGSRSDDEEPVCAAVAFCFDLGEGTRFKYAAAGGDHIQLVSQQWQATTL
jgi:hypothetical protein